MAGVGRVFLRGSTWYFAFSHRGRETVRSSHSTSREVAARQLRAALKQVGAGYSFDEERITFEDLINKVRLDRADNQRKNADMGTRLKHLRPYFGQMRAVELTTQAVDGYKRLRLAEGAARGTINRELSLLRRAVNLGKLARKPDIKLFAEDAPRNDMLTRAEFEAVRDHLPPDFRDIVSFLYGSSWRQGQVAALEWRDVNLHDGEVTARGETTKSGDPHRIPLIGELAEIIERARALRRLDCPYVFHRNGHPFRLRGSTSPLREAWRAACARAGLPGHLLHGLRRSGVTNMINAGVDPAVAMAISGHKTQSMLHRYRIVKMDNLRTALERTQEHLAAEPGENKVRVIR